MPTIKKTVGQITLKVLTDVESTTYYYLLQSSMAPAPSAPTTNPPGSGWSTTEPEFFSYIPTQDTIVVSGKDYYTRSGSAGSYTYTIVSNPTGNPSTNSYYEKIYGDTRSLYVTVQTLYTDGTYEYTTPSLSSSYEAAKEAYNRAQSALTIAGDINQYFWALSSGYSSSVPAGVYVTNIPQNQFKSAPAQGNILMQSTGITIRNGATELASLTGTALNFYKPGAGSQTPSIQLSNSALTIYNPNNNARTLTLDSSGLSFYGSNTSTADVILDSSGLTLLKGGIKSGSIVTPEQDGFLYLSPQVYTGVISGHSAGQIPIDNYVKSNWRQIIGRNFAVDTDGNLYANGLNANNANIEGDITATSLTIGSGSDTYDGAAAINISGYDIEIEKNGTDEIEGETVYLYPILYHNGEKVPDTEIDYSHFVWYQDDSTTGTAGDANNQGRYLATYGHNYRVTYDFDDGAVGGGTEVQTRYVDPEKYITKVNDTEITVHPESYQNVSSYIRLGTSGLNIYNSSGNSIAQYGSTARVGLNNSSRFLMNNNSLQAYDNNNVKYFEVSSSGLNWGSQTAATTDQVSNLSSQLADKANTSDVNRAVSDAEGRAAMTATSYISTIDGGGIRVHDAEDDDNYAKIDATGLEVFNDLNDVSTSVAKFGATSRIGESTSTSPHIDLTNKFMQISNNEKSYFGAGFVNQSASLIRIPFEAKECEGTSTLTLTTNCTIASINEIRGYTYAAKLIPLVPNLNYTFVPGTNTVTLLNLDDLFIESSYEFYIDYNTAQFASLQGNYAPVLDEYNSFFGSTYIPEHKIAGVISVRVDGEPVTSSNYNVNQDGSISFTGTGTNDSHFIHISYVTNDSLFAVTGEDQQGVIGVNSVSFGKDNQVSGGYSGAIGKGLTTASSYQFAIGKYNKCEQDSLFMVGNGDAPYSAKLCLKLTNANNHPVLTLDLSQVSETLFGGSFFFTTPDQYKWFNTIPWYDPDDPIIDVTDAMRVDNQDITFNTHAAVDSIEVIAIMLRQRMDEGEQNIYLDEDENIIPATNTLTTVYATVAALESNVFEVKTDGEVLIKEQPVEGFVVEQGESGIWTYRKWNNWTVDCWGRWEETITNYGTWNNMASYKSSTKQLPFEIHDAVPTYSAKIANGYVLGCSMLGAYANPLSEINLFASASASGLQSVTWACDIKGKWY